jgi:hypothetical protein
LQFLPLNISARKTMKHSTAHFLSLASVALALSACGGGDEPATVATLPAAVPTTEPAPAPVEPVAATTPVALVCDPTAFSIPATVPTAAQLTAYAKTYTGSVGTISSTTFAFTKTGDATLVFKADGTATYNGAELALKSVCYLDDPRSKSIVLHWGAKTTVGAGSVYDNHVDLFADGTASGSIGADIFKSP